MRNAPLLPIDPDDEPTVVIPRQPGDRRQNERRRRDRLASNAMLAAVFCSGLTAGFAAALLALLMLQ